MFIHVFAHLVVIPFVLAVYYLLQSWGPKLPLPQTWDAFQAVEVAFIRIISIVPLITCAVLLLGILVEVLDSLFSQYVRKFKR